MDFLNQLGNIQLPEISTDVGADLDTVVKKNAMGLAILIFIAVLFAIVLGLYISKKLN